MYDGIVSFIDSTDSNGKVYVDTQWIKIHFVVTDTFYYPEYYTCERVPRVTVSNVGSAGNQEEGNQMYYNGHDYLFEFTNVWASYCYIAGPVTATWLHDRHDYLAENHIEVNDYPALKVTVIYDMAAPLAIEQDTLHLVHHPWSGWTKFSKWVNIEYDDMKICIVKEWWKWNKPPIWWPDPWDTMTVPINNAYFGVAADWDVPEDAGRRNNGDWDEDLDLIWLQGDTAGFENYYGAFLFLNAAIVHDVDGNPEPSDTVYYSEDPYAAHILNNATQLYPFGGYNDDSLYKYMSTPGYSKEQDSAQDMNIVISAVPEVLNADTFTIVVADYVLLVTDQGEADLTRMADLVHKVKAGDANVDGNVSVSDVVYLINYLFKGGTEPWLAFSDANGDEGISVSDVVYLINYLFKGGDPPVIIWCRIAAMP